MRVLFTALSRWFDLGRPELDKVEPSFGAESFAGESLAADTLRKAMASADPMFPAAPADRTDLSALRAVSLRQEPELEPTTICDIPL